MITFASSHNKGLIDQVSPKLVKDLSYEGKILGKEHQVSALSQTRFLFDHGAKLDFIFYFALMWDAKFKNLDSKSVSFLCDDKILISNSILHLIAVKQFFSILDIETEILGERSPFSSIMVDIANQQSFIGISRFKVGYDFEDGFLDELKVSHGEIKPIEKKNKEVTEEPIKKAKRVKPLDKKPIETGYKDYCSSKTNSGLCCTNDCSIFKYGICSMNFDSKMSDSEYTDVHTVTLDEIKIFFEPTIL